MIMLSRMFWCSSGWVFILDIHIQIKLGQFQNRKFGEDGKQSRLRQKCSHGHVINKNNLQEVINPFMLEINGISSPRRIHNVRLQKYSQRMAVQQSTPLFDQQKMNELRQTAPSYLPSETSHRQKCISPQQKHKKRASTFKVCHSKDVFVFSRKQSFSVNKINVSQGKKLCFSQDRKCSDTEVFLPLSPKKMYRIMSKTSYGQRERKETDEHKRKASSSKNARISRLQPEPWELTVQQMDFDNLF